MATLNHEVWANPTTPLFLQSGASANNTAPLSLGSTPLPSTQRTTITSTATNGGIYYGANTGTQTQAYGELSFSNAGGWALKTNNITQMAGTSGVDGGVITTSAPIVVSDPKTNTALEITTSSIGATPNNPATTIVFGTSSINIGQGVVASDGTGLLVQNSGGTSVAVVAPLTTIFASVTQTPSTTTYNFSGAVLPPSTNYYIANTYGGFIMSSDQPPSYASGVTNTNPSASVVAVSASGTPPSSSVGLWVGTAPSILIKSMYIEFPPITSTAGTTISVQWKQAGLYTNGAIYKNDVRLADLSSYSSSTWITSPTYTFTSTGDDRIYIEINNTGAAPIAGYYYYNISDIAITTYSPTNTTAGQMGMNGSAIRMTNGTSGSYVEADSISGGASLNSSSANGTSVVLTNKVRLNSATNGVDVNGQMNMLSNSISNTPSVYFTGGGQIVGAYSQQLNLQASNIYSFGDFNMYGTANINMSNNNLTGASNITTTLLDGVSGGNLYLGNNSSSMSASNLYAINCVAGGGLITNMRTINNSPACAGAVVQFLNNIGGYHIGSLYIPPKPVARIYNNYIFGNSWVGNEYINAQGITIPPYSVFTYSNTGGSQVVYSNATTTGYFQADTGFYPSSSTQVYTLTPILV